MSLEPAAGVSDYDWWEPNFWLIPIRKHKYKIIAALLFIILYHIFVDGRRKQDPGYPASGKGDQQERKWWHKQLKPSN